MTCYFRHLGDIFMKAGIEVTKESKQKIDNVIHDMVNVQYKNCPVTWTEVKKRLAEDEDGFALKLKNAWNNQ